MRRAGVIVIVFAVVAGACGGVDVAETSTTTPTTQPGTTTTAAEPTTTTTTPETTMSLPGEPIEIGPQAGDLLAVIGVAHNDILNVRAAPGIDQPVIEELDPLSVDVLALGNTRALSRSFWIEIEANGVTGWANASFLGYIGQTTDVTAAVVEELGELPWAPTMEDLGMVVYGSLGVDGPPSGIIVSVAPTYGDLAEATFDVIGIQDDAVRGFRVHVFATPDEDGEGFVLKSVEQTVLCGRGVSGELCV